MKSQERMKFWRQHIEAQQLSRVSAAAYCVREKVSLYSFYQWRKRLSKSARAPVVRAARGFASVEIIGRPKSEFAGSDHSCPQMPDPKWTAAFVSHLLREYAR
jgi:hypothetical protein